MVSQEKITDMVRDGLKDLHEHIPDKERFTYEAVIRSAWRHHPRYRKKLAAAERQGDERANLEEELESIKPSWKFRLPGFPTAINDLTESGEVVREFEVDGTVVDRAVYLDPEQNDGVRHSLNAQEHQRFRLAAAATEEPAAGRPDLVEIAREAGFDV